jgi:hypothetical protein
MRREPLPDERVSRRLITTSFGRPDEESKTVHRLLEYSASLATFRRCGLEQTHHDIVR